MSPLSILKGKNCVNQVTKQSQCHMSHSYSWWEDVSTILSNIDSSISMHFHNAIQLCNEFISAIKAYFSCKKEMKVSAILHVNSSED